MTTRIFDNGEVTIGMEMPAALAYVPDTRALAASPVPIVVAAGEEAEMFYYGASRWLAGRLGTQLRELPGGHTGYADVPADFARALLHLLESGATPARTTGHLALYNETPLHEAVDFRLPLPVHRSDQRLVREPVLALALEEGQRMGPGRLQVSHGGGVARTRGGHVGSGVGAGRGGRG